MAIINLLPRKIGGGGGTDIQPLTYYSTNDYIPKQLVKPEIGATFQYIVLYGYEYGSDLELVDTNLTISVESGGYGVTYKGVYYPLGDAQTPVIFKLPEPYTISAQATIGSRLNARMILATGGVIDTSKIVKTTGASLPGTPVTMAKGASIRYIRIKDKARIYTDVQMDNSGYPDAYSFLLQPYNGLIKIGNYQDSQAVNDDIYDLGDELTIPNFDPTWYGCNVDIQWNVGAAMDFSK